VLPGSSLNTTCAPDVLLFIEERQVELDTGDMERLVVWKGLDADRWEVAHVRFSATGVAASGTQVGFEPVPYRLDYELEATHDFVTELLDVRVRGDDWSRRLLLSPDPPNSDLKSIAS